MKQLVVIGLLLASMGWQARADGGACLDKNLLKEIQSKITLKTHDLAQFDVCDPKTNTYKVYQALSLMRTIQFEEGALAKPFNQNILPNDFWGYFIGRAKTVQDEDHCQNGVLAFVYGLSHDGVVHLCPYLYKDEFTVFERAQAMLHEARHFEGYAHVTCTRGPRNGQAGACDDSVDELGSYAVTVESLTKMALSMKNLAATQRTMVKVLALTYGNDTFNAPIRPRDLAAFYLVTDQDQGMIYSDLGPVKVATLGGDKLISRGAALAVFPKNKGDAYTANVFSQTLDPSPAMGSFSAQYNAKPQSERPDVVDILNLGYVTAAITTTGVDGRVIGTLRDDVDDTTAITPFPISAAYAGQEVGQTDKDSIYVVDNQNQMHRVQFLPGGKYKIWAMENPLGSVIHVGIFNDSLIGLDTNGELLTGTKGSWTAFSPLTQYRFSQMSRPFQWDQYFEDSADLYLTLK